MPRHLLAFAALAGCLWLAPSFARADAPASQKPAFDHVYVIVLENHDFDDAFSAERTPFLERLAREQGLATQYYGVAHPSLPNYLALIGGDVFGVADDAPSCFASDLTPVQPCHHIEGDSLVDQLETAGLTFAAYFQSLPEAGGLRQGIPGPGTLALYAQKHNPFAYYDAIAKNPARLARLKPFEALAGDLKGQAASFVFIVPDQCHDGHGLPQCSDEAQLQQDYDAFVASAIELIRASKNFTERSAIVVTFDEGESQHKTEAAAETDNRIPTVVVTKSGHAKTTAARLDHYALLATIEDGFGLSRLRNAAGAPTLGALFPRLRSAPGEAAK
ncbi:MAG TPA: alkaline phosphatase family protein [Methylocystis sp.]|nr:alkaline phosphatase family protein [Methylocystis sp.]